jgi:hypothetical protein
LDDCHELVIASIDKVNQLSIASITGETRHILTGANPAVDMVSPHALSPFFLPLAGIVHEFINPGHSSSVNDQDGFVLFSGWGLEPETDVFIVEW